jgi:hypothetical protein
VRSIAYENPKLACEAKLVDVPEPAFEGFEFGGKAIRAGFDLELRGAGQTLTCVIDTHSLPCETHLSWSAECTLIRAMARARNLSPAGVRVIVASTGRIEKLLPEDTILTGALEDFVRNGSDSVEKLA